MGVIDKYNTDYLKKEFPRIKKKVKILTKSRDGRYQYGKDRCVKSNSRQTAALLATSSYSVQKQ